MAPLPVIDTHVHLFADPADEHFPPHPNAPYLPGTGQTPEQLLSLMDQTGIYGAVLVHPEPYQDDHRWLIHALAQNSERFRGVCHLFPDPMDTPKRMIELAHVPGIVGVRLHAYCPDRLPSLETNSLMRFWSAARDAHIFIQLHLEPRYAIAFTPILEQFPEVTVLVDHCGRPLQGSRDEFVEILDWAQFPKVHVKLSLLPYPDQYPHRDIRPIAWELASRFGKKRILYGGGFPCGSEEEWGAHIDRFLDILGRPGPEETALILSGNAARIMNWPVPPTHPI